MLLSLVKDASMGLDFETEWFESASYNHPAVRRKITTLSLQIDWKNVSGSKNGNIEISATNDMESFPFSRVYNLSSESNDSQIILIYPFYKYFKIKYYKNGNTDGIMNISSYCDVN